MTIVNCGVCGKKIYITNSNAYDKISKHRKSCKPKESNLAMSIGYYLSKVVRDYE